MSVWATVTVLGTKNQESDGAYSPVTSIVLHIGGNAASVRREGNEFLGTKFALDGALLVEPEVVRMGQRPGASQRALVTRVRMRPKQEYLTLDYLHSKVVALLVRPRGERMDGLYMHSHSC